MKNSLIILVAFVSAAFNCFAQNDELWNGKKCAVVLTYDDGLNAHLDNAIPALDSLGLRGTFYIPGNARTLKDRMDEWRLVATNGHELGNHTLFHPCDGRLPERAWVSKDHNLADYTLNQIVDEILVGNTLLKAVDGKTERTFAYTCGDREAEGKEFYKNISNQFLAARGVPSALNLMETVDLSNINAYMINGQSGEDLIRLVGEAKKSNALIVFLFHGVGGEHSLNVSLPAHRQLLTYLKENESSVWTVSLAEVAKYIVEFRDSSK